MVQYIVFNSQVLWPEFFADSLGQLFAWYLFQFIKITNLINGSRNDKALINSCYDILSTPQGIWSSWLEIRSHSLKEKYLNYKHHNVKVFITKSFFTSSFLSMEYWKLCQDWWWLWWWRFLAMWETTQKASRNCAQFELCGKDLPSLASFWKQKMLLSGLCRAPPLAAAWSGTSLTHQCFRKQLYTFAATWKS